MILTRSRLKEVGRDLHGGTWPSGLAHDLGVSKKTIKRWAAGRCGIPSGAKDKIEALIRARIEKLHGYIPNA